MSSTLLLICLMVGLVEANPETIFVLPGGATMEMVWIEPGTFTMGTTEEQKQLMLSERLWNDWFTNEFPAHQVTITQGFYMGKYELTQGQWESVMGTRPWEVDSQVQDSPKYPAVIISPEDVMVFCTALNMAEGAEVYRLPTEAEWEYACRAGTTTLWSFGDDKRQLRDYGWYYDNARKVGEDYAHEVGKKLPNPWGLYDMYGNVSESVWDWYGAYTDAPQVDPTGPTEPPDPEKMGRARVGRGGRFANDVRRVRSASRDLGSANNRYSGARLVRMVHPTGTPVSPETWGQVKKGYAEP